MMHQGKMALRNIFRHGIRSLAVLIIMGISGLVIILIGGFYSSLFGIVEEQQISTEGHITLTANNSSSDQDSLILRYPEVEKILMADPNVRVAVPRVSINGLVGFGDRSVLFSGHGVDYEKEQLLTHWKDNPEKIVEETGKGAFLGVVLAENLRVKPGDTVNTMVGWNGFSLNVVDTVTTMSADLDRFYLQIPLDTAWKALNTKGVHSVHILVKNPGKLNETTDRLVNTLAANDFDVQAVTYSESGSYFQRVKDIYNSNYHFVLIVILLTVFFAVFNTITMSLMERTREMGTLRSIGLSKAHVSRLVLWEGIMLGGTGFLFASILGVITVLIIKASGGIYMPPPPTVEKGLYVNCHLSPGGFVTAFIVLIAVSVVSSMLSTRKMNSLTIVEELGHV